MIELQRNKYFYGGFFMPVIRPLTDLRNKFTELSNIVHAKQEPIFLTKNGTGDMVVMSIEYYDKQMALNEIRTKLAEAEAEIANGVELIPHKEAMQNLRERINGKSV